MATLSVKTRSSLPNFSLLSMWSLAILGMVGLMLISLQIAVFVLGGIILWHAWVSRRVLKHADCIPLSIASPHSAELIAELISSGDKRSSPTIYVAFDPAHRSASVQAGFTGANLLLSPTAVHLAHSNPEAFQAIVTHELHHVYSFDYLSTRLVQALMLLTLSVGVIMLVRTVELPVSFVNPDPVVTEDTVHYPTPYYRINSDYEWPDSFTYLLLIPLIYSIIATTGLMRYQELLADIAVYRRYGTSMPLWVALLRISSYQQVINYNARKVYFGYTAPEFITRTLDQLSRVITRFVYNTHHQPSRLRLKAGHFKHSDHAYRSVLIFSIVANSIGVLLYPVGIDRIVYIMFFSVQFVTAILICASAYVYCAHEHSNLLGYNARILIAYSIGAAIPGVLYTLITNTALSAPYMNEDVLPFVASNATLVFGILLTHLFIPILTGLSLSNHPLKSLMLNHPKIWIAVSIILAFVMLCWILLLALALWGLASIVIAFYWSFTSPPISIIWTRLFILLIVLVLGTPVALLLSYLSIRFYIHHYASGTNFVKTNDIVTFNY